MYGSMLPVWKTPVFRPCCTNRSLHSGKRKNKFGSNALGADHIDVFIVGLDHFFYNGQAEPCPFFVFSTGEIRFVEALPYLVQIFSGDADPPVFDGDESLVVFLADLHCDRRFRIAEFDGVVDQVVKDLLDLAPVRIDDDRAGHQDQFNGNMFRRADRFKGSGRIFDRFLDIEFSFIVGMFYGFLLIDLYKTMDIATTLRKLAKENDAKVIAYRNLKDNFIKEVKQYKRRTDIFKYPDPKTLRKLFDDLEMAGNNQRK